MDTNNVSFSGLSLQDAFWKRLFDIVVSFVSLLILGWLIFFAWIAATVDTRSNGFFVQRRVGRNGKLFPVIKIKTMHPGSSNSSTVTTVDDARISFTGKIFRKTKIDELPQLLNVLVGQMSVVGPRPDVPGFADRLVGEDRIVLSIRPGITGPASIKYKDEEVLLARHPNPEEFNREIIFPDKVSINKGYIEHYSFSKDIVYIWRTIFAESNDGR